MNLPAHIFSDLFLVQADYTHPVPFGPAVSASVSLFQLVVQIENLDGALPFQETNGL